MIKTDLFETSLKSAKVIAVKGEAVYLKSAEGWQRSLFSKTKLFEALTKRGYEVKHRIVDYSIEVA